MLMWFNQLKTKTRVLWRRGLDRLRTKAKEAVGAVRLRKRALDAGLNAWEDCLKKTNGINQFEPLTPVLLDRGLFSRYEQELAGALRNDQVRNIALTGDYGAGKSSVIRTFVERHPEFSYAFVSLATFGKETSAEVAVRLRDSSGLARESRQPDVTVGNEGSGNVADLIGRIEETIVQQLLYAVSAIKLPRSRLKRIAQPSQLKLWIKTIGIFSIIIAGLRLYVPTLEKVPKIDPAWLLELLLKLPGGVAVGVAGAGICYFLHLAVRLFSVVNIDGFALKGGTLETTHYGSVLHKNIDEIIYCFERSSVDVVIIEDLDRFGIQDVFARLREINFIIKQSPQVTRRVYFVYALRDEMFAVGEKTKFFDFIIPVIPVINMDNSKEKMVELLRARYFNGASLDEKLSPTLVEQVCYYIDDMRLVKNIVNEFDMFCSALSSKLQLDHNKLFAMVVIRNLHPAAYTDLVKRKGPIYKVMQTFSSWREKELRSIQFQMESNRERFDSAIAAGDDRESERHEREFVLLQTKHEQISRRSFTMAARKEYQGVIMDELRDYEVVRFFMRSGYLDLSCMDYYGHFYEGSFTSEDKSLLLMLQAGELPKVDSPAFNASLILSKLDGDDLDYGRGVVIAFVEYLMARPCQRGTPENESGKLAFIFQTAAVSHIDRLALLTLEFLARPNRDTYIRTVFKLAPGLYRQLFEDAEIFQEDLPRQQLVCAIIDALDEAAIIELEGDERHEVFSVIESLEDVSLLMPGLESADNSWELLRSKPIVFGQLGDNVKMADLEKLIAWGCIDMSYFMLRLVCSKAKRLGANEPGAEHPEEVISYRKLHELQIPNFDEYLFKDARRFVNLLVEQNTPLDEDASSLSHLLNALDERSQLVKSLLRFTTCKLEFLTDVPSWQWPELLETNRVVNISAAVWSYFKLYIYRSHEKSGVNIRSSYNARVLGTYVEKNIVEINSAQWQGDELADQFLSYLFNASEVSNTSLEHILQNLAINDMHILDKNLSSERWAMLVESQSLGYAKEILDLMVNSAPDYVGRYLIKRWGEAGRNIELLELPVQVIYELSKSDKLTLTEKVKLWHGVSEAELDGNLFARRERVRIFEENNQGGVEVPGTLA